MDGAARALALCVEPDDDSLLIGGDFWPRSVDRRRPGLDAWPQGRFSTVALRLPKAREELVMLCHAGAGTLTDGGTLYLFGENGEGIGSAGHVLGQVFDAVETVQTKFHARVFAARGPRDGLRSQLADWRTTFAFEADGARFAHARYPGVFANARLDAGTAFLLESLPALTGDVLDFACGSGPIAQVLAARQGEVRLTLADIDAVALTAARENVPGAGVHQIARLTDLPAATFDAIVSNPPFHQGVAQSFTVLREFLAAAPDYLAKGGEMFIVVQRTVPVAKLAGGLAATKHAANDAFTVWSLRAR